MNATVMGSVQENRRMNVELGQVQVFDSGADGNPNTTDEDSTAFNAFKNRPAGSGSRRERLVPPHDRRGNGQSG
jgi:hypothetical protein